MGFYIVYESLLSTLIGNNSALCRAILIFKNLLFSDDEWPGTSFKLHDSVWNLLAQPDSRTI